MKRKKTSTAVEFKPIHEVLGIDDSLDSVDGQDAYDVKDFVQEVQVYGYMLKSINKRLDGYVKDYEKDPSNRSMIEAAYTSKINVLAELAKLCMPVTSYGRKKLREIRKCSREYETFVSPLITQITKDNIEAFSKVLTPDLKEDVETGNLYAIGAVRNRNGKMYGAGAAVYRVDASPFDDAGIGRILWLYVHEAFRQQGIGNHLMAELLATMMEKGIEHITVSGPTGDGEDKDRLKAYLISSWSFDLESSVNSDSIMRVGDIKNINRIKEMIKGVRLISDLQDGMNSNVVKNALRRFGRPGYLTNDLLSSDYIDPDLSFCLGTETTISGLLFAHRLPSGMIRVEYLKTDQDSDEDKKKLLSAFFKAASIHAFDDTLLYIPIDSDEIAVFIEEISPTQMAQYYLEGVMIPTSGYDNDIDEKRVKGWLEYENKEIE